MTEQSSQPSQRKRRLLYILFTAVILSAIWISYFLVNFDLNNYRKDAEKSLSAMLSLPVTLGEIRYNFYDANLALQIDGLQLGDNESKIMAKAKRVMVNLQWMGLLTREFKFAKISLEQPQVLIRAVADEASSDDGRSPKATPSIDYSLLQTISINALEINDGTLLIEAARNEKPKQSFELSEFDAELSNLRLNATFQLNMKGQLKIPNQKGTSLCQVQGEGALRLEEGQGLVPTFNFELDAKDLDLESFRATFARQLASDVISGTSDLHLHLQGGASEGVDFQINLTSKDMALRPSAAHTNPISLRNLLASGHLQPQGPQPGIEELSLQIDDSRLAGQVHWTPPKEPFSATVTLVNSRLKIPRIKQWLPQNQESLQQLQQHLQDKGAVQIDRAQITLRKKQGKERVWQLDKIKGELQQIGWTLEDAPDAKLASLPFNMIGNKWQIDNGNGNIGALQLVIDGAGEYNGGHLVLSSLDLGGEVQSEAFLKEWHLLQEDLQASGQVELKGHFEGPLSQLNLDLQANLSQLNITHSSGIEFPSEPQDKLSLHGTVTPEKILLDHGALKWSDIRGHVSGSYLLDSPDSLKLEALLTVDDLASATDAFPLLKKMQLHGQADLSIRQRGLPKDSRPEMTLTLRDAGLHATRFIADLSHINGRVKLTETGMSAEDLQVHLGESPLTVQAQVNDFTTPVLFLDVKAKTIHADDLVFNSGKAMLRDVVGHLEIDRDGLSFAPVDVRLDGGTKASVRGTISFHPPFDVLLDITSEFANVAEIVRLWTDHSTKTKEPAPTKAQGSKKKATVTIKASATSGDLYGMNFHDATATITPSTERLTIYPLHLSVGEGYSDAQVISEFAKDGRPTMLRVSGHAEQVDALEVYRELLNQRNILRGKLRGDFFINGETGANYLPSSYGNFSIQVKDGVLHEFPVLSKIFSLLNISQVFAFSLPDMHLEGMPFNNLTANFILEKGVLKTEDLKIESEAMNQSYLGTVNLVNKEADLSVAIHPLGTVDKIVSHIPVAGWLLTGENKALLTAHFSVRGPIGDVSVSPMPLDTLTDPTIGLLQRTLGLPFKLIKDPQILWGGDGTEQSIEEE
jgi:hypothetical protein